MQLNINRLREMKGRGEKLPMLTAYDYATARLIDEAGMPLILVGDSLGMAVLGYDSTIPVTLEEMIHHTKAVTRGVKNSLVIGDMPFMTYHTSVEDALRNAGRFLQEGGAQAVKLEGGEEVMEKVEKLVRCGIPVMGHLGYTPQSVYQLGGPRAVGKERDSASQLLKDALSLEQAGAFALVLELVPAPLAGLITQKLSIPTIGIGSGKDCDGQVQVISDILGLFADFAPRHAKRYARLSEIIEEAVGEFIAEVKSGSFPTSKESISMDESLLADLDT